MALGPVNLLGEGRATDQLRPTAITAQTLGKLRTCLSHMGPSCLLGRCGLPRDGDNHLVLGVPPPRARGKPISVGEV